MKKPTSSDPSSAKTATAATTQTVSAKREVLTKINGTQ